MTIWHYRLPIDQDTITLALPKGARLLSVAPRDNWPFLYALVEPDAPKVERMLALRGTGKPADGLSLAPFVGTFALDGCAIVGHVFDLGEAP